MLSDVVLPSLGKPRGFNSLSITNNHGVVMKNFYMFFLLLQAAARCFISLSLWLISLWLTSAVLFAQWSTDPNTNNPICTAAGDQSAPTIVSDGSGGAIITWPDNRSGNYNIYAQRIDASGVVQWTTDGAAISTAAGDQIAPTIVSDGSGGAIITWYDYRSGTNFDIYAQRIDNAGNVQWTLDGVAISTAANDQFSPTITSDGSGGAIITWHDYRSGTNNDIYAQRINSAGVVQWTTDGVAISTAANDQFSPTITSDGSGGAIITWYDYRSGNYDIYAQRINSAGVVQWTADGVAISTAADDQYYPTIVSDGSGGAIITWEDYRSGPADIYAQRIDNAGNVQWTTDGAAISTAAGGQYNTKITDDGSGGAIITWEDYRSGTNYDTYAQRIDNAGNVQWTPDGVAISTAAGNQFSPTIVSDGSGGAIVTWEDHRSGTNFDIYAQRIDNAGNVQWTPDGVAISTAAANQLSPTIVSDGSGGAIIAWSDSRSGPADIYAQHVTPEGNLGTNTYTITASVVGNGTIEPSGQVAIAHGGDTTFIITPAEGHHLDSLTVDGVKVDSTTSYTFTNVTSNHTITAYFSINKYALTVNIEGEGSVTKIPNAATYDHGTEVKLVPTPNTYWLFDTWSGDTTSTSGDTAFVLMDAAKTVTATFAGDPIWFAEYRTATMEDWATAVDAKGKPKAIKCKPDKVTFKFQLTAPAAATGLTVKIGMVSSGSVTDASKSTTYATWTDAKEVTYTGSISEGQVIQIEGTGSKGKYVKPSYKWETSPKATKGKVTAFIEHLLRYPMPNLNNVGEELGSWPTIGNSSGASSVIHPKYKDVQKSLNSKGMLHTGDAGCLDVFTSNNKPISKQQKSLPAAKHDNKLFAEALTFGLNLRASEVQKFPLGLGALVWNGGGLYQGLSLDSIFTIVNSYLGCDTVAQNDTVGIADSLYNLLVKIDSTFAGELDTVSWNCTMLQMTGVKALKDVPYLSPGSPVAPQRTGPKPILAQAEPTQYQLQQNYPNPFNPTTTIAFDLVDDAIVTLKIYNMLGQEVTTLINNEIYESGNNEIDFDASALPSGVYFYRLSVQPLDEDGVAGAPLTQVKKMLLVK
jgi:hypothetical protein